MSKLKIMTYLNTLVNISKSYWVVFLPFALSMLLLIPFQNYFVFCDEVDNILGGLSVASGKDIYKFMYSQHTPVTYYISGILGFLGAKTYEAFRIYWFICISLFWAFLSYRYFKKAGLAALLLLIIAFSVSVPFHWGHMLLSDHVAAFALLALFLELKRFLENDKPNLTLYSLCSIYVFLSAGSAFVTVYQGFFTGIGIALLTLIRTDKPYTNKLKQLGYLCFIVALPFIILILWYYLTGNLKNAYFQAYEFNVKYYSKYMNGFGSNLWEQFYKIPQIWINYIKSVVLFRLDKEFIFNYFLVFSGLIFSVQCLIQRKYALLLFFNLAWCFSSIRGFDSWHAAPFISLSLLAFALICLNIFVLFPWCNWQSRIYCMLIPMFIIFLACTTYQKFQQSFLNNFFNKQSEHYASAYDAIIQLGTVKGEKIFVSSLMPHLFLKNQRESATKARGMVPWLCDAFCPEIIADLQKEKPRIVIFSPEDDTWGFKAGIYAKDLYNFILTDYVQLEQKHPWKQNVYVLRNELEYWRKISADM